MTRRRILACCACLLVFFRSIAAPEPESAGGTTTIQVVDESGKPISDATITLDGLRGTASSSGHYSLRNKARWGKAVKTDSMGKAVVPYPLFIDVGENNRTTMISFSVSHPNYLAVRPTRYSIDKPEAPQVLKKGFELRVSGWIGNKETSFPGIVPYVSAMETFVMPKDWVDAGSGVLKTGKAEPGLRFLFLAARPETNGPLWFSETELFDHQQNRELHLELKRGIRLEGKLDPGLKRPVKNGKVFISVRPREFRPGLGVQHGYALHRQYGSFTWHDWATITEEGTFSFDSLPFGELDVISIGDGFVSKNGENEQNRRLGIPQPFLLSAPITKIVVTTEKTGACDIRLVNAEGKPIPGAAVGFSPNVMWNPHGTMIFAGDSYRTQDRLFPKPGVLLAAFAASRGSTYSAISDASGVAKLRNIPVFTRSFHVTHASFEVPIQPGVFGSHRSLGVDLLPGLTNKLEVILQPKGKEFLGNSKGQ